MSDRNAGLRGEKEKAEVRTRTEDGKEERRRRTNCWDRSGTGEKESRFGNRVKLATKRRRK